ncbi:MAG: bifunctional serine/threonine-protein kinase/formylglycine-generating enzyme family protein [Acidobacteriota bacterium]
MKKEDWNRIQEVFPDLQGLPPDERAKHLDRACGDDFWLREVIETMLSGDERCDAFLEPPSAVELLLEARPSGSGDSWLPDRYRLGEEVGRGGMGLVHRAEDTELGRTVAIKVLSPWRANDETIERLRREARAAGRLNHDSLVSVHDVGEHDGLHYFTMELIEGCSLRDVILRRRTKDVELGDRWRAIAELGPRAWVETMTLVVAHVADGLAHAHENGVLHRDVTPQNVLLDAEGRPKLVDFGLARHLELSDLTSSFGPGGTPSYMSPEQARQARDEIDHRSDLFSLAVVLYEALTLRRPFEGEGLADTLDAIQHHEPTPPIVLEPAVGSDLSKVIMTALAKRPEERYPTASAFARDLRAALAGGGIRARGLSWRRRWSSFCSRHPRVLQVGLVLLTAVLGIGGTALFWPPAREYLARPRIHVEALSSTSGRPDDLRVLRVPLDPIDGPSGPATVLGDAPLEKAVVPGHQRLVLVDDSGTRAELTRRVQESMSLEVRLRESSLATVTDVVLVEAARVLLRGNGPPGSPLDLHAVDVPAFFIDRHEVSNADYAEFLEWLALNAPADLAEREPRVWPEPFPEGFGERPVVGVDQHDARSFCEWRGLRLPTVPEWMLAAATAEGLPYPWGRESDELGRRAVVGRPRFEPGDAEWGSDEHVRRLTAHYLTVVEPVDSHPDGRSVAGLHHVLGNVEEWTEGLWVDVNDAGEWVPHPNERITMGGSWARDPRIARLDVWGRAPFDLDLQAFIGFRCACSQRAPSTDGG